MNRRIPLVLAAMTFAAMASAQAKNVILMIADGSGFNSYGATRMFSAQPPVFDGPAWLKMACATYPLNLSSKPQKTNKQLESVVYDPQKAWDPENGYKWLKGGATDSAAAGTALGTGVLTYNNAIGWSDMDKPLRNIHQAMKSGGRSTGVVTSVPWSHATPAAMVAHNPTRNDYKGIAQEMVLKTGVDLIMGAGHPWYDGNGTKLKKPTSGDYVGGIDLYNKMVANKTPYRFIDSLQDFNLLAQGRLDMKGKNKLVGTARVSDTLQQGRKATDDPKFTSVGADPKIKTVPTLATMTKGAINLLSKNPKGFFLMVEGGAVDWANHANQPGRCIEEGLEFNQAVAAVAAWIEKNGGWAKNLLIVTADHETGLIWGPDSKKTPFDKLVANGPNKKPGMAYNYGSHSNSLVPLFARGYGADKFRELKKGEDPVYGPYVQNIDVFRAMVSAANVK